MMLTRCMSKEFNGVSQTLFIVCSPYQTIDVSPTTTHLPLHCAKVCVDVFLNDRCLLCILKCDFHAVHVEKNQCLFLDPGETFSGRRRCISKPSCLCQIQVLHRNATDQGESFHFCLSESTRLFSNFHQL